MSEIKQGFKCIICEKWSIGWGDNKQYGNNPAPIMNHGECCDGCNELVLQARFRKVNEKKEDK